MIVKNLESGWLFSMKFQLNFFRKTKRTVDIFTTIEFFKNNEVSLTVAFDQFDTTADHTIFYTQRVC